MVRRAAAGGEIYRVMDRAKGENETLAFSGARARAAPVRSSEAEQVRGEPSSTKTLGSSVFSGIQGACSASIQTKARLHLTGPVFPSSTDQSGP